jgi:hypothetical protein
LGVPFGERIGLHTLKGGAERDIMESGIICIFHQAGKGSKRKKTEMERDIKKRSKINCVTRCNLIAYGLQELFVTSDYFNSYSKVHCFRYLNNIYHVQPITIFKKMLFSFFLYVFFRFYVGASSCVNKESPS